MSEVSIFVDESGGQGGDSKYYVLTMLFHDQADDIAPIIDRHRKGLLNEDSSTCRSTPGR